MSVFGIQFAGVKLITKSAVTFPGFSTNRPVNSIKTFQISK